MKDKRIAIPLDGKTAAALEAAAKKNIRTVGAQAALILREALLPQPKDGRAA